MKAYKFLMDGYKSKFENFQYTIGQTYIHEGEIELRKSGFHASKEIRDAIQHCSGSHLVEVELGGRIVEGEDKVVASEITILKELDIVKKLRTLARSRNKNVRNAVASNPNTPTELIETLAGDEHWWVRSGVALNFKTPVKILRTLTQDEDWCVRSIVAKNPNIS